MQFDDFLKVVDLLKDPAKYEAKVAELQSRNDAIQASIAELGIKGDIGKAQAKAEALVTKAEQTVADATVQAEVIVANARSAFDKRHTELKAREVVSDQALANYNTIKAQQAGREDALRTSEKAIDALRSTLETERASLAAKQLEVDERLAKLRQVMG